MKTIHRTQKLLLGLAAGLMLSFVAQAADPAGTWIWTMPGRNGGPDRTNTLTLKIDASKQLTGKITAPRRGGQTADTDITDGKVDGDTISFAVIREYNGNSMTNKYTGTVTDDTITGKIAYTRNGEEQSRDWKAKRSASADTTK
jgi:phage head maturation protease